MITQAIPAPGVPDLIEAVVGFRQWRLGDGGLHSLFNGMPWPSAELSADCPLGVHPPGDVPAPACTCGIYAYYEPRPRLSSAADYVGGAIVLWGAIELHATGMRGSHARIVALERPWGARKRRAVSEIAERLGVPVVGHRELAMTATTDGKPLQHSLRPSDGYRAESSYQRPGLVPRAVASLIDAIGKRGPSRQEA